jgi:ankyrin repeat protein
MPIGRAETLIKACFDDLEKAETLIHHDPEIIYAKDGLGETALHYLAVENQIEAVKFLYEKGADLNTVSECGGTPLSEAASLGYVELVRWLLENGARIDGEFGVGDPILHEAVRSGNAEIVKLLVEFGASIYAKNDLNESPLHASAADDDWLDVTKYLIETGATIDEEGCSNDTPLLVAVLHGAVKTVKYLLSAGAALTVKDSKGRTPSQLARECKYNELANWLEATEAETYPNQTNSADAEKPRG